jgi:hypothetical protein
MNKVIAVCAIFIFFTNIAFSQVTQQWVTRYNGTGNTDDIAKAVKADNSGNVYVTGSGTSSVTQQDIITIKYDRQNGNILWFSTYAGPLVDCPLAMAVDDNFVYVTGYTFPVTLQRDVITIKYNSSTGDTIWVRKYNGIGNGGDYGIDIISDISGNIYVTGRSDAGGAQKFVTIKYNSAGVQEWVSVYTGSLSGSFDEAHSIKLDAAGNVYVTGVTRTSGIGDYLTLKMDNSGAVQWVKKYNGPANGDDIAVGLEMDASGSNLFAAGYSWSGAAGYDYFTIKYNSSSGDSVASAIYNGPWGANDIITAMTKDESDNIYITGYSIGMASIYNYATVKYNSGLVQQWVSRYTGNYGEDFADAIAYKSGFIYVTGYSTGNGSGYDYATVKYDGNGNQIWLQRYNGPGNNNDYSDAIALDYASNVYVTGYSTGIGSAYDFATIKYSQPCVNPPLVNAGHDTAIYIGYGIDHIVLNASISGGTAPFIYLWSTGDTTQSITVSPDTTTSYIILVKDALDCTSRDTVTVEVVDVRCGNNNDKILVCHNGHTICISRSAVPAHLNHGDYLGECSSHPSGKPMSEIPETYKLYANYPNPFNPSTMIRFDLPLDSYTKLIIYDAIGREVARLADGNMKAGSYELEWNANNFASGIYYYKLEAGDFIRTMKMVLMK